MTTRTFTAIEFIAASEPWLLSLVEDPSTEGSTRGLTAFVGDTERAHEVAEQGGLKRDDQGRYPPLVWMIVFP